MPGTRPRGTGTGTRWMTKYNEVVGFIETNHRNPSRHRIEEHDMLNWLKANRKLMNAGKLKEERIDIFKELLVLGANNIKELINTL